MNPSTSMSFTQRQFQLDSQPYISATMINTFEERPRTLVKVDSRTRKSDELFLKSFTDNLENVTPEINNEDNIINSKDVICKMYHCTQELAELNNKLKSKNLSDEQWNEYTTICESLKNQIQLLQKSVQISHLKTVRMKLKKRKSLRNRCKKRNQEMAARKKQMHEQNKNLATMISNWIKEKQNDVAEEIDRENLRKDADIILSDVRIKRTNCKKSILILQEIENLRKIQVTIARSRGENFPLEADEVFNNIIDKLKQQWAVLDKEYLLEEKGLKLMVKSDNEKKVTKQTKNIFADWEKSIFGQKMFQDCHTSNNTDNLVLIRTMWDAYINNAEGSSIPIGWVMPSPPSSAAWTKCLKKD